MTRLNKALRAKIEKSLMHHRFKKPAQKLLDRQYTIARKVYSKMYTKEEHELIASLPEGWMCTTRDLDVYDYGSRTRLHVCKPRFAGGRYDKLRDLGADDKKHEGDEYRIAQRHTYGHVANADKFPELGKWQQEVDKLTEEADKVRSQVRATLGAFTTIEKLIKSWPEVEPFAIAFVEAPNKIPALPVVPAQQLNLMLELP